MSLDSVKTMADTIRAEVGKAIIGQTDTVDLMLVALFSGGHVLLEGVPGTAKTFLAQAFARQTLVKKHFTQLCNGLWQFFPLDLCKTGCKLWRNACAYKPYAGFHALLVLLPDRNKVELKICPHRRV